MKPYIVRSLILALVFQVAWLIAALVAWRLGDMVNIGLLLGMLPVLWVPALFELVFRVQLPTLIQVGFGLLLTASSILGTAFGWYASVPDWDTWVHLYSGVVLAGFGWFIVQTVAAKRSVMLPTWFYMIVAVAISLTFAVLWEISEFIFDRWFGGKTQPGLEDTMIDMVAGAVGALVFCAGVGILRVMKTLRGHRQQGSATVIVAVVIVLALLGGLGYFFWQNFSGTGSDSAQTTNATEENEYLKTVTIAEWGATATYESRNDYGYRIEEDSLHLTDESLPEVCNQYAGIITQMAADDEVLLFAGQTAAQVYAEQESDKTRSQEQARIGDTYYFYESPQAVCPENSIAPAVVARMTDMTRASREVIASLKALE